MKVTLKWDGDSGDRKRAFVVAEENDGWQDLRIEVDTDDCDREHAMKMMQEVIDRCSSAPQLKSTLEGIEQIIGNVNHTIGHGDFCVYCAVGEPEVVV